MSVESTDASQLVVIQLRVLPFPDGAYEDFALRVAVRSAEKVFAGVCVKSLFFTENVPDESGQKQMWQTLSIHLSGIEVRGVDFLSGLLEIKRALMSREEVGEDLSDIASWRGACEKVPSADVCVAKDGVLYDLPGTEPEYLYN